jgi:succinate dehydrogenase/fumarate reductase-like Fe-S protein
LLLVYTGGRGRKTALKSPETDLVMEMSPVLKALVEVSVWLEEDVEEATEHTSLEHSRETENKRLLKEMVKWR